MERSFTHWFTSPHGQNGKGWGKPKLRAPSRASMWMTQAQALTFATFPAALTKS